MNIYQNVQMKTGEILNELKWVLKVGVYIFVWNNLIFKYNVFAIHLLIVILNLNRIFYFLNIYIKYII